MSRTANVVIIGAGVVGSSVAYYLSKMGWHNIAVVDKGELYDNDGSTSHAPGGVVPLTFNKLMTWFGFNSVKLYKSLNASAFRSDRNPANQPGGMEVTRHKNRLEDLKRLEGIAKSYGQEAHMITPEDIKRMWPQVNAEQYYGGIFVPGNSQNMIYGHKLCHITEILHAITFAKTQLSWPTL